MSDTYTDAVLTDTSAPPPQAQADLAPDIEAMAGPVPAAPKADLAGLLERATAPPDQGLIDQFTGLKTQERDAFTRQQAQNDRVFNEDRARAKKAFDAESATIDHTPKWDAEEQKRKYATNPIESFGSYATVFALIASAFTRAPMENALNGAAAAMNAIKEGNEKEYERAFDAWKANTDLAVKRFNMQHAALGDAFNIMSHDQQRGNAKLLETLTRYGMEKELILYQNGMIPEIQQKQASELKSITEISRIMSEQDRIEEMRRYTKVREQNADTASRRADTSATVQQQNADTASRRVDTAASKPPLVTPNRIEGTEIKRRQEELIAEGKGPAEALAQAERESHDRADKGLNARDRDKLRVQLSQYDQQAKEVDRAIKIIEKFGDVGVGGKLKRPAQTLGNLFGFTSRTDAKQLEAALSEIRLRAPALLTQSSTSTPRLKAAYELIENAVPGLEMGASPQNVLEQLRHLKTEFGVFREHTAGRLNDSSRPSAGSASTPAPESTPTPAPKSEWWKDGVPVQ